MTGIYALFETPQAAQRAFDGLRAGTVPVQRITVMSSEPLEGWELADHHRETVMPWMAVLGAGVGLVSAYLLTALTQSAWPINTGGMPIVTNWTNIIILFELTMLGAVLATVFTLLVSARLPARLPRLYDPDVSNGRILVGVEDPADSEVDRIERALRAARPERVGKIG